MSDDIEVDVEQAGYVLDKVQRAVESFVPKAGAFLVRKLRYCETEDLRALKRELRAFDSVTGKWREK